MRLEELDDKDLDVLVTRALGYDVLGRAWCDYDPESGALEIDLFQDSQHGFEHYVYVRDCICQDEELDYHPMSNEKQIFGHWLFCLAPVPEWSVNYQHAMRIMESEHIAVWPEQGTWKAQCLKTMPAPVVEAGRPQLAIARAYVALHFGIELN